MTQLWDSMQVAESIESYWQRSMHERAHRETLADLLASYIVSPDLRVLEVGCGTGLIYERLVERFVLERNYVGVDSSTAMLEIARRKHGSARLIRSDGYALPFADQAFDIVLCVQVLGHVLKAGAFLNELLRVTKSTCLFTVWPSPNENNINGEEEHCGVKFPHRLYANGFIRKLLTEQAGIRDDAVEVAVLSAECWAYVAHKRADVTKVRGRGTFPFPGYQERLNRCAEDAVKQVTREKDETIAELKQGIARHTKQTEYTAQQLAKEKDAEILSLQRKITDHEAEIGNLQASLRVFRTLENRARVLAIEVDHLRGRRVTRWLSRFRPPRDLRDDVDPAFRQLSEDGRLFTSDLKGFRLGPSRNLENVPFLVYPLNLGRRNLAGVLLAPILDLPTTGGELGVEILSPANTGVAQSLVPLGHIDERAPTRFDFSPISDSDRGRFWLRVFVRGASCPVRVFEWRKYRLCGLGRLQTRAFCGFLFASPPTVGGKPSERGAKP